MGFIPYDLSREQLAELQLRGLRWTVSHVYRHSPHYRKKFDAMGLKPEDIQTLEDIRYLSFTDKEDLQQGYPFPLRSVDYGDIVRIHASSGTTGKRKVLCYTQKDIDIWADIGNLCMAYQPGRFIVTNATSLPLGIPNARVGSLVLLDLYRKYQPKAFSKVKVLTMFTLRKHAAMRP